MKTIMEQGARPIKIWTSEVEASAMAQLKNLARLPFIAKNGIAVMPDVHAGIGSTVGSVIATHKAILPSTVGVDIGCGMNAVRTSLVASDLPESLKSMRDNIETVVPVGFSMHQSDNVVDGNWLGRESLYGSGLRLLNEFPEMGAKLSSIMKQLGTLGGGNHFIEVCLDEDQAVWVMLHSGSRGTGNAIGKHFIDKAKEACAQWHIELPDNDLA